MVKKVNNPEYAFGSTMLPPIRVNKIFFWLLPENKKENRIGFEFSTNPSMTNIIKVDAEIITNQFLSFV